VLPISEIAEPGFEGWRVVFFNNGAVGEDGGRASDGCPLARTVKEGDVDVVCLS